MTQPLMTNLIEAKRSVRRLYTESLVGRGDITEEEYEKAKQDFQNRLEIAFAETHAAETGATGIVSPAVTGGVEQAVGEPETTGVATEVVHQIGDAFVNKPDGFTVHNKLQQLLEKRLDMSRNGQIDWGFGELLAFGSVLMEGTNVRLAGQDARVERSSSATPCSTTGRTDRSGFRWRTCRRARAGSTSTTPCSASMRRWRSSTGIPSSGPTRSPCGRRSSATSRTVPSR